MSRHANPVPSYRLHKQSGQGITTIHLSDGRRKDVMLGRYGSDESRSNYARLLTELKTGVPEAIAGRADLTVNEVIVAFHCHAQAHYRRADGTLTDEVREFTRSFVPVKAMYGHTVAADFGPRALKASQQWMIDTGWSRKLINQRIGRIRRAFKWAVAEELVPPSVLQGLQAVQGLQRGRSKVREAPPVLPVGEADVVAVLDQVRPEVRAMIEVQRLTGMRPGEVCLMRPVDIDRTGPTWLYTPAYHKLAYRGQSRTVAIGPQAQRVLSGILPDDSTAYIFSPRRAMAAFNAVRDEARQTPRWPSHLDRNVKKRTKAPRRPLADHYTTQSYGLAIARGCEKAAVPHWHPNQLRHTFATRAREQFGLDVCGGVKVRRMRFLSVSVRIDCGTYFGVLAPAQVRLLTADRRNDVAEVGSGRSSGSDPRPWPTTNRR